MKFKKPSGTKVKDTIALTGGVLAGGALSRGIFGLVHENQPTEDPAAQKKQENTALVKRGVMVVGAGAAAAFIDGNDIVATLVKGACIGITVVQGLELVKTLASRSGVTPESSATTVTQKFLAQTTGLGCPCSESKGLMYSAPVMSPRYERSLFEADRGLGNAAETDLWAAGDLWAMPASA